MNPYISHISKLSNKTVLYRFQPIARDKCKGEDRIDSITDGKIWLSDPNTFNDPFDVDIKIKDQLNSPYSDDTISQVVSLLLDNCETDNLNSVLTSDFINSIKPLIKDPARIDEISQIIKARVKNQGIVCLTPHINNVLMWAHYAESHKGFAIEYSFDTDISGGEWTQNHVEYTSKLDTFSYADILLNPNRMLEKLASIKSTHWAYENEIRLINRNHKNCLVDLPNAMKVTGIYAGCNTESQYGKKLKDKAKQLGVKFFKMRTDGYNIIPDKPGVISIK